MNLKTKLIHALGGLSLDEMPQDLKEEIGIAKKPKRPTVFLTDPTAEEEKEAEEEIKRPAWKKFMDSFRINHE